ncbi:Uncharacterised protein [Segatella copri]|nr:Uncharacterised protein [Segatella copri]
MSRSSFRTSNHRQLKVLQFGQRKNLLDILIICYNTDTSRFQSVWIQAQRCYHIRQSHLHRLNRFTFHRTRSINQYINR